MTSDPEPRRLLPSRTGGQHALGLTPTGPEPVAAAAAAGEGRRGHSCDGECRRFAHIPWRFAARAVLWRGRASQNEGPTDCRPGGPRSGAWAVAGEEEVVMGDWQTLVGVHFWLPRPVPRRLPWSRPRWRSSKRRAHASARTEFLIPRQNIGIQLHSVRDRADADLSGTLAMLAEIGYTEVKPFSYHGRTPAQFRRCSTPSAPCGRVPRRRRSVPQRARHRARRGRAARPAERRRVVRDVCLATRASTSLAYRRFAREFNRLGRAAPNAACASTSTTTAGTSPSRAARFSTTCSCKETHDYLVFF